MKPALLLVLLAGLLLLTYIDLAPHLQGLGGGQQLEAPRPDAVNGTGVPDNGAVPQGMVLDVSVHSLEELRILLDRAEELAMRPQPQGE